MLQALVIFIYSCNSISFSNTLNQAQIISNIPSPNTVMYPKERLSLGDISFLAFIGSCSSLVERTVVVREKGVRFSPSAFTGGQDE